MIEMQRLKQITEVVRRAGLNEQTLSGLREHFSGIHFTCCSDDDVGAAIPYLEDACFNLYLVGGRDHCMSLTKDLEAATGVLLTEVEPDA